MTTTVPAIDVLPPSRRVGLRVARAAVVTISVYLIAVACTVLTAEPDQWTIPVWVAAGITGAVYFVRPSSDGWRSLWLTLLTVCALGRSLTLLFAGSAYLGRGMEIAASLSWLIVWLAGILAALVLTADRILTGK